MNSRSRTPNPSPVQLLLDKRLKELMKRRRVLRREVEVRWVLDSKARDATTVRCASNTMLEGGGRKSDRLSDVLCLVSLCLMEVVHTPSVD